MKNWVQTTEQYARASEGFNRVALSYDTLYGVQAQNPLVRRLKAENRAMLEAAFPPETRLLEIGCGTGEDAVHLARVGRTILATDISLEMIRLTERRAWEAGVAERVTTRVLAAGEVASPTDAHAAQAFDGAFSCFTLGYEPNLTSVAAGLARLLRPGAPLLATVYSRACVWEMLWLLAHFHPRGAFWRWRQWPTAQIGAGEKLQTQYYTPRGLERALSPHFRLERARALLLTWPPPFLERVYRKHSRLFERSMLLEVRLRDRWPFNAWGYAFVALLRPTGL